MKITVKALEIYHNGILYGIQVLGDEDSYDREVCVTYYDITDLNEMKEALKGYSQNSLEHYLGKAAVHGEITWSGEACYAPVKLGSTEVKLVDKTFDWGKGETNDRI